jgi:hypothetical protein
VEVAPLLFRDNGNRRPWYFFGKHH